MPLRILSDFDGVWTDQHAEAQAVVDFFVEELARHARVDADEALRDFQAFEREVAAAPDRYGWAPDGILAAYVDEDPFMLTSGIAMHIDERAARGDDDGPAAAYRAALAEAGFATPAAFADHCFLAGTKRYRENHEHTLVEGSVETFEALHDLGVVLVIVSNSTSEKIVGWLRHAGVDAGEDEGHLVRVHGQAGKQTVDPGGSTLSVANRTVHVERPKYRAVVESEDPDLVVGDVFSLDLALPHAMRVAGEDKAPASLALRRHDHTPGWVLDDRADGAIDHVIEGVADLVGLVRRMQEERS